MLSASKMKIIEELTAAWNREELTWLNGYLSGFLAQEKTDSQPQVQKPPAGKITITYGTESGNSKKLATHFALKAKKLGITTKLVGLDQYRLPDLQKEEFFLTIMSTQG